MENKEIELYASNNSILISQICEILKNNEIPYLIKTKGAGSYLNITFGKTTEETSIIIPQENLEKARNLIANLLPTGNKEEELTEEEKEDVKKYTTMRRLGVIGFAIIPTIILIIAIAIAINLG